SGDQLYNMDFRDLVEQAKSTDADLTVATLPVGRKAATRMGVMHVDESGKIERFVEKPKDPALLDEFVSPYLTSQKKPYLASMGIYLYKRKALLKQLETSQGVDFGMHLIPEKVAEGRAFAYVYHGYWEDIGTIGTFYKANMDLAKKNPPFDLYRDEAQVFSHVYHLPGARIVSAKITESIICEGSIVEAKEVTGSILGPRSLIGEGAVIDHTYMMGNDSYAPPVKDSPSYPSSFEVGENSIISGAILDKHVRIGKNVQLINKKKLEEYDSPDGTLYVRDGVIIVTRGSEIPDGFEF
ncbi:MAG: glucose-1-phosphate adenylyltransferase, partial [Chlamydiia bacterium]|nr:glucose-1-phosphate adenylyltransferase [Chlamydiia bacterium]